MEGWSEAVTGDVFETVTGSTPSKSQKRFYGNHIPFVKPGELTDGEVYESVDGLSESGADEARIAPSGSIFTVGRPSRHLGNQLSLS